MAVVVLRNDVCMPRIGLGTYQMNESDLTVAIPASLDCGYRCFDTAASYKNEKYLGEILERELALRGLQRSDVFISSKLRPADQGYENAKTAIAKSSRLLGGYIDLFLIHWPGVNKKPPGDAVHSVKRAESWVALQEAMEEGRLVRAIGVSNYNISHLNDMQQSPGYRIQPMVNQVELHPAHHPLDLIAYCRSHGIHLQAYSSLGQGRLLSDEVYSTFPRLIQIAEKHFSNSASSSSNSVTKCPASCVANLYLKWAIQMEFSIIPRSRNPKRIEENFMACVSSSDDKISDPDMEYIGAMQQVMPLRQCWDSSVVL